MEKASVISPTAAKNRWWILGITSLALFFIQLDVTIVNTAMPSIMNYFTSDISSLEWVLNAYVLTFAVLLITWGRFGDLRGRKFLFLVGVAIFVVASAACSYAPSMNFLIGARAFQAIGGAAIMPATIALVTVTFTGKDRGTAFGIWGGTAGLASAIGPTLGGFLVQNFSWHYIFLINVPIGIIILALAWFKVQESTDPGATRRFDWGGVAAITACLFCLSFALIQGQSYGWTSATIIALLVVSVVSLVAFIFWEGRAKVPLLQLNLFRNAVFTAGNVAGLLLMFAMIASLFLFALFLQLSLGLSPLEAGIMLTPISAAALVCAPLSGRLSDKFGSRWFVCLGFISIGVSLLLMGNLTSSMDKMSLIGPLLLLGAGMGLIMAPITSAVMARVPPEQAGSASGVLSTTRQIGSVLGISVIGAVFTNNLVSNLTGAVTGLPIPPSAKEQILANFSGGTLSMGAMGPQGTGPFAEQAAALFRQAFAESVSSSLFVPMVLCFVGAVVAAVFLKGKNVAVSGTTAKEISGKEPPVAP
jgi:EmrB/QacA subfamily drug resistance transporter